MTDRHAGYVVVLEANVREDDAGPIIEAISMIKGVLSIEPVVGDAAVVIAESRVRTAYGEKLSTAITEVLKGS